MAELVRGKALSEITIDGETVKPGQTFEAEQKTIDHLISIGVVEDPAVAKAAREAEKASTAEADEKAAKIIEAAKNEAAKILEEAADEADSKAQTALSQAHAKADKIVEDARAEATILVDEAKAEAGKAVKTTETDGTGDKAAKPGKQSK